MVKIGTPNLNTEIKLVNDVNNFTNSLIMKRLQ